jgi:hypothetical protein
MRLTICLTLVFATLTLSGCKKPDKYDFRTPVRSPMAQS